MSSLDDTQYCILCEQLGRELVAERAKLAEAQAVIAMLNEALIEAAVYLNSDPNVTYVEVLAHCNKVLGDAAADIAAWWAEKLKPLRREVAMLRNALEHFAWLKFGVDWNIGTHAKHHRQKTEQFLKDGFDSAINVAQATALAYDETIRKAERERIADWFEFAPVQYGKEVSSTIREMK